MPLLLSTFITFLLSSYTSLVWCSQASENDIVRQDSGMNQINTTICWWTEPRAAIIRDTLYIDGGYIGYLPRYANGTVGAIDQPEDGSTLYALNFTQPFSTSDNASIVLQAIPKTAGAANNLAPNYYDGMMFANDNEFYLYGGVLADTDSLQPPPATSVLGYERYQYGPYRDSWSVGFYDGELSDNMTRYVTAGAGVNIPSENMGFYFSGMRGEDWGDIRTGGRPQYNATVLADTLLSVNMSIMRGEVWSNFTLPSTVSGRANAELVWIPVSEQGILLAIGGVFNPEWAFMQETSAQTAQSQDQSTGFMTSISIYDISSRNWYMQPTQGDTPPQLTQACSVVASAQDGSSYNVYLYGGYDGLNATQAPFDDVYILSVPSFTWIKAYTGNFTHGRRGHKCAKLYPDQMLVVGGQAQDSDSYQCLGGGVLQVFNINSLTWQNSYDPNVWSEYEVPSIVTAKIGGNANGSATTLEPSTWANTALPALFSTKYTKTITNYYPYPSINATSPSPSRNTAILPTPLPHKSGTPSYAAPVLGVVLGLVGATAIVGCFFIWWRRQYIKRHDSGGTEDGTVTNHYIMNWINRTVSTKGAPTVTTEPMAATSPTMSPLVSPTREVPPDIVEAGSIQVHEMPDTSTPTELPLTTTVLATQTSPTTGLSNPRLFSRTTSPVSSHISPSPTLSRHPSFPISSPDPSAPTSPININNASSAATKPIPSRQVSALSKETIVSEMLSPGSVGSWQEGDENGMVRRRSVGLMSPISPESAGKGNAKGSGSGMARRQSSFHERL